MEAAVAVDNVSLIYNGTSINAVNNQLIQGKTAAHTGIVLLERENEKNVYTLQNKMMVNPLGRSVINQNSRASGYYIFLKEKTQQ